MAPAASPLKWLSSRSFGFETSTFSSFFNLGVSSTQAHATRSEQRDAVLEAAERRMTEAQSRAPWRHEKRAVSESFRILMGRISSRKLKEHA